MPLGSALLKVTVIANFILIVAAIMMLLLEHENSANYVWIIAVVIALGLILLALYEIFTSANVETSIKVAWVLVFIFANTIATIVYYFYYRDKYIIKD